MGDRKEYCILMNRDESENILTPVSLDAQEIMSFQVLWSTSEIRIFRHAKDF